MKKIALSILAIAGVLISCQQEPDSPSKANPGTSFTVTAAQGCPDWNAGDSLSVVDNTGGHLFKAESAGRTAVFKGKSYASAEQRVFLSPYSKNLVFNPSSLEIEIPQVQTSCRPVSYGRSSSDNLTLKLASSRITFSLSSEDIVSVSVEGLSGESLSGKAIIDLDNDTVTPSQASGTLTLLPSGGQKYLPKGEHSLVCLPGEVSGLRFTAVHEGNLSSVFESSSLDAGVIDTEAPWDRRVVDISLVFITKPGESSLVWPFANIAATNIPSSAANAVFGGIEKAFTMPEAQGGYSFKVYTSTGIVKNSMQGFCMYGQSGDYMTLPVIPGLMLTSVKLLSGNSGTSYRITKADGSPVAGGGAYSIFPSSGGTFTWNLYGAEADTEYRLETGYTSCSIQQLHLRYEGRAPEAPTGLISPNDYGLKEAKNGEERYYAIYQAHVHAIAEDRDLDYSGIGAVDLEIPLGASSIPLRPNTDFKGTVFRVKNTSKKLFLFALKNARNPVTVTGAQIDAADYSAVPALASGLNVLAIEDQTPWVDNRQGYDYGATRREAVLVRDGKGSNGPVSPYSTEASIVKAWYSPADDSEKTFSNIVLERDPSCTVITNLVQFDMINNIRLSNVKVVTPKSDLYGDGTISFTYCTNVTLEDGIFDGNYSASDKFGYSISCNATWNALFRRIKSNCPWAVFGNNNTHRSIIENCDIERFDTHCYGRDITMRDCILNGKGLPVSSIFGDILLERCNFKNCYLYAMRPDYNAYVDFNLTIKDCETTLRSGTLINMGRLDNVINARPELSKKRWPNITIDGLKVNMISGITRLSLIYVPSNTYGQPLGHMQNISISGLKFIYPEGAPTADFQISSVPVTLESPLNFSFSGSSMAAPGGAVPTVYLNVHGPSDNISVDDPNIKFENVK